MSESAPRRRRFRFRLSWLLVLLTVACLFLGRKAYLAREQADATKVILAAKGDIGYEHEVEALSVLAQPENPSPRWLRRTLGEEYFRIPVSGTLDTLDRRRRGRATPVEVAALGKLRHLQWVAIIGSESIGDDTLAHLTGLQQLRELYLVQTKVTGVGFSHLAHLPIAHLQLKNNPVTDEGLKQIARLEQLKYIGLENSAITDSGIAHLASLPQLEELQLSYTAITDAALVSLEKAPKLKSITLMETKVSSQGVDQFARAVPNCEVHMHYTQGEVIDDEPLFAEGEVITKATIEEKLESMEVAYEIGIDTNRPDRPITSFTMDADNFGPQVVLQLVRSMPQLESLRLDNMWFSDDLFAGLKQCQHLRVLSLHEGVHTAEGLAHLQQVRSLREVELYRIYLDDFLDELVKLKQLEALRIQDEYCSPKGIEALRAGLPGCRVTVHEPPCTLRGIHAMLQPSRGAL